MKKYSKHIINLKNSNNAVSELLGTILLLGIAVAIFSVLYLIVLSQSFDTSEPNPTIVATIEDNYIIFEHRGGEELGMDAEITLDLGNGPETKIVGELLIDTNRDGKWNIGEKLAYEFEYSLNSSEAEVFSVDEEGTETLLMGTLDIHPESDIGIECTVDNQFPTVGSDVVFTITVTLYRGDMNAMGIIVQYVLPGSLAYNGSSTTQGNYNNDTGNWSVGKLEVRKSATLTITATVVGTGETIPTQLVMILDGSLSINESNWNIFTRGVADAIESEYFPHDGSVELTVIQFGGYYYNSHNARLEVGPIEVTETNYQSIANSIWSSNYSKLAQLKGYTPLSCGIRLANDALINSDNFDTHEHIITLVTDGNPNGVGSNDGEFEMISWGTDDSDYAAGVADAESARNHAINNTLFSEDELDVLAVKGATTWGGPSFPELISWLKGDIVWPGNYEWIDDEPPGPGWIREIDSWEDFPDSINEMFEVLFNSITNTVEIMTSIPIDPNAENNQISITIFPQNP